jgi:hypothetical protein
MTVAVGTGLAGGSTTGLLRITSTPTSPHLDLSRVERLQPFTGIKCSF